MSFTCKSFMFLRFYVDKKRKIFQKKLGGGVGYWCPCPSFLYGPEHSTFFDFDITIEDNTFLYMKKG